VRGVSIVGAALLAACGGHRSDDRVDVAPACARPTGDLAGAWDDERRAAVSASFHRIPRGDDTFARVATSLDRAANAWLDARAAACELGRGSGSAAAAVAVAETACLRDYRRELASLTTAFAAATPDVVAHARASTVELPPLARCTDATAMGRMPPPPTGDAAAHLDALADRLATARAAAASGKPSDALAIADDVMAAPEVAHDAPLAIAGELSRAEWLTASGRLDDARTSATRAYELAVGIGDDRGELLAAADVAALAAYDVSRVADARHWLHTGQILLARLDGERELEARLALVEGTVEIVAGVPAAAAPALALAVADDRKLDPDHPSLGAALALLGSAEIDVGKVADAERDLRDALAHQRRDLGDDSPEVASAEINLALAQAARGFYADAARSLDDALALQARVLGADHVAGAYAYLARVEVDKGRGDRAAAARDAAEAGRIARAAFGDQGQLVAQALLAEAELDADAGRGDDAVTAAMRGRELSVGLDDGSRAVADATVARALAAAGRASAAVALAKQAMARVDDTRVSSSTRALVATTYGELLLARGDAAGALSPLREAEAAFVEGRPSPWRLVRTRFALARALAATDRAAGIDEAKLALGEAPRDGEAAVRAEIETWIAKK
jgi:tetratricopeptide (TPR) repeat protein